MRCDKLLGPIAVPLIATIAAVLFVTGGISMLLLILDPATCGPSLFVPFVMCTAGSIALVAFAIDEWAWLLRIREQNAIRNMYRKDTRNGRS